MQKTSFSEKLLFLRKQKDLSQKEFAEYLNIPQPTMSAYENGRISPTVDVLINIAKKYNVSLDWLCDLSSSPHSISTTGDFADFFFKLMELSEIHGEIEINDRLFNDLETETEKYYVRITFYGRVMRFKYNGDACDILRKVKELFAGLETYALSKEIYDEKKREVLEYHTLPLSQKDFCLTPDEQLRRYRSYLETQIK